MLYLEAAEEICAKPYGCAGHTLYLNCSNVLLLRHFEVAQAQAALHMTVPAAEPYPVAAEPASGPALQPQTGLRPWISADPPPAGKTHKR